MNWNISKQYKVYVLRVGMIVLSICFSVLFTHMIFIVYMWHAGIFSYDMFDVGSFALEIFYAFTIVLLSLGAIAFAGVCIPIIRILRGGSNSLWFFILVLACINSAALLGLFTVIVATHAGNLLTWFVLVVFFVLLAFHIEGLIFDLPETQIKRLLGLFAFSIFMCIFIPEAMAHIWQFPLERFGIGGGLWVTVEDREGRFQKPLEGNLILLSPKNIYMKVMGESQITIVPISASLKITTDRERSFKDEWHAKQYMHEKGIHKPQLLDMLERATSSPEATPKH